MAGPTDMPVYAGPSSMSEATRPAVPRAVRQPGRFAFRCTMSRTNRDQALSSAEPFQKVPEERAGKNRLHLDLYPTGRDDAMPMTRRVELVEAKVADLVALGASVERRTRHDDDDDPFYFAVLHDPEGNEFCIS
jgi:hypothetical protein